jgi:hypothetical protein
MAKNAMQAAGGQNIGPDGEPRFYCPAESNANLI